MQRKVTAIVSGYISELGKTSIHSTLRSTDGLYICIFEK